MGTSAFTDTVTIPLPTAIDGWEDNMKTWPKITYSSIFSYFLNSVASDGEAVNLKAPRLISIYTVTRLVVFC